MCSMKAGMPAASGTSWPRACGAIISLMAVQCRPRTDVAEGIAPAGEPGVGRDLDQHDVERRNRRGALLEARNARVVGDADVVRPDIGDQHGFPPERLTGRLDIIAIKAPYRMHGSATGA